MSLSWWKVWLTAMGLAGAVVTNILFFSSQLTLCCSGFYVKPLLSVLRFNAASRVTTLVEIIAVDTLHNSKEFAKNRFNVLYSFLSIEQNYRLNVRTCPDVHNSLPSVYTLFNNSNWLEREVYEMFGIFFTENLDLRRLLTDYGFTGFPLRRDFPLSGYIELRFDETTNTLIYEQLELTQDFRLFSSMSPWE